MRQPLPIIPIPLKRGDPDVPLDVQAVATTVYDRARYDLTLDYSSALSPPLSKSEGAWAKRLLAPRLSAVRFSHRDGRVEAT